MSAPVTVSVQTVNVHVQRRDEAARVQSSYEEAAGGVQAASTDHVHVACTLFSWVRKGVAWREGLACTGWYFMDGGARMHART